MATLNVRLVFAGGRGADPPVQGPALAGVLVAVQVGGRPGRGLADGRAAGGGYRLAAKLRRHDGYGQFLARLLHDPHHECDSDKYL